MADPQTDEAKVTAVGAGPVQEARAPTASDLSALLAEFERATAAPAKAEPAKVEAANADADPYDLTDDITKSEVKADAATPEKPDPVAEAIKQSLDRGAVTDQLKAHLGHYASLVERMQANEIQRQAQADFENIVAHGERELKTAGLFVGEGCVKQWLAGEAMLDPALRDAFDHRYDSDQHGRRAKKLIGKAIERMVASVKSQPDPAVTADKYAVTWAVKNSNQAAPAERPKDLGAMNDKTFAEELRKLGIG
jgi:hypothetical protein